VAPETQKVVTPVKTTEPIVINSSSRFCKECLKWKPLTEYYPIKTKRGQKYSKECKSCTDSFLKISNVPAVKQEETFSCALCKQTVPVKDAFMFRKESAHNFCQPCANIIAINVEKQNNSVFTVAKEYAEEKIVKVAPAVPQVRKPKLEDALL